MPGKPWTAEDEDRLRQLLAEGLEYLDIAAALGRTAVAVRCRASQLGLKHPKALEKRRKYSCDWYGSKH